METNEIRIYDELDPRLRESIQRGLEQSKKEDGISHEEFMKEVRDRLNKKGQLAKMSFFETDIID